MIFWIVVSGVIFCFLISLMMLIKFGIKKRTYEKIFNAFLTSSGDSKLKLFDDVRKNN